MKKIICFKIDKLLKKYRLSQRQVAIECNIRPATMKLYVDNKIQRINMSDLQNLYNFFYEIDDRTQLNDLIDTENSSMNDLMKEISNKIFEKD